MSLARGERLRLLPGMLIVEPGTESCTALYTSKQASESVKTRTQQAQKNVGRLVKNTSIHVKNEVYSILTCFHLMLAVTLTCNPDG